MFLKDIKFSIWCDFVERGFLQEEFAKLIKDGKINGATSNPSIFHNAFLNFDTYKNEIKKSSLSKKSLYESLAIFDINLAAKKLEFLYEKDDDGFVSIEIDPTLCHDAKESIKEGIRLFQQINQPNVMIKVPATNAGYEVMSELLANGIHVNATLVFSPLQASKCLNAFKLANEKLKAKNAKLPKAVISVFVSRFDRLVDKNLKNLPKFSLGIMNATKIYHLIQDENLENVRCLFASTGVSSDEIKQDYYIKELCFKNSINTAPPKSMNFALEKNDLVEKKPATKEEIENFFDKLSLELNIIQVYDKLLEDGLKAFIQAYEELLKAL